MILNLKKKLKPSKLQIFKEFDFTAYTEGNIFKPESHTS